jgi:hypothetical protein
MTLELEGGGLQGLACSSHKCGRIFPVLDYKARSSCLLDFGAKRILE